MTDELEFTIMQLITYAGDARSLAIQAIRTARNGEFEQADQLMRECEEKRRDERARLKKSTAAERCQRSGSGKWPVLVYELSLAQHPLLLLTPKDSVAGYYREHRFVSLGGG